MMMSAGTNGAGSKSSIAAKMISIRGAIPNGTVWITITSETTMLESRLCSLVLRSAVYKSNFEDATELTVRGALVCPQKVHT